MDSFNNVVRHRNHEARQSTIDETAEMFVSALPAFRNREGNPYNALLYRAIENGGVNVVEFRIRSLLRNKCDIFHIHWPDLAINHNNILGSIHNILVIFGIVMLCKIKMAKIIWTVHNIMPHDNYNSSFARRFLHWFAKTCDGFIFLSKVSEEKFLDLYSLKQIPPCAVIPHGHYRSAYPHVISKEEARKKLNIPDFSKVVLLFGQIRPYKSIETLIRVFSDVKTEGAFLLVGGKGNNQELVRTLRLAAEKADNVRLDLKFITNDEVSHYFSASDMVVLPYSNMLNSGVALLALSFNRPVLMPNVGSTRELRDFVGDAWVQLYDGEIDAQTIDRFLANSCQDAETCNLDGLDWGYLASETINLYRKVLGHSREISVRPGRV